jgi:hypothetical protein
MKTTLRRSGLLIASMLATLVVSVAQAVTLQMPTPQDMDVYVCVGANPYVAYQVTGNAANGNITGLVFQQVKCTQHSGKGGGSTGYHAACALVYWDPPTGTVQEINVLYTTAGRIPASPDACLNPVG